MNGSGVFAQFVLYNAIKTHGADCLSNSIHSLLKIDGIQIHVCDNGSTDETWNFLNSEFGEADLVITRNDINLGFSGAYNLATKTFLDSDCKYFLIINGDVRLETDAVQKMVEGFETDSTIGSTCCKLYRSDDKLAPVDPPVIDSAGMELTTAIRHLDRGSQEIDSGQYGEQEYVFGGTGACVLYKRECVEDLLVDVGKPSDRPQLFDEAFFAYREDADLAWRAVLFGWKCLFVPSAIGYHKRVVLPERRKQLPAEINSWSVRNRFLLQINNYSFNRWPEALLPGIIFRNLVVIFGVLLRERSSIKGLVEVWKMRKQAFAKRAFIQQRAKERDEAQR